MKRSEDVTKFERLKHTNKTSTSGKGVYPEYVCVQLLTVSAGWQCRAAVELWHCDWESKSKWVKPSFFISYTRVVWVEICSLYCNELRCQRGEKKNTFFLKKEEESESDFLAKYVNRNKGFDCSYVWSQCAGNNIRSINLNKIIIIEKCRLICTGYKSKSRGSRLKKERKKEAATSRVNIHPPADPPVCVLHTNWLKRCHFKTFLNGTVFIIHDILFHE